MDLKNHPRPQLVRNTEFTLLDGSWKFLFDDEDLGFSKKWYSNFPNDTQDIIVPFSYQTKASGINCVEHHNIMWYKKTFEYKIISKEKKLLHFNAVDYHAQVWLNGVYLGVHEGGYSPFFFDVSETIIVGANDLVLRIFDPRDCTQPRGKQSWKDPFGCWYHPTSGIWQSVWIEEVGNSYFRQFKITPDIDNKKININLELNTFTSNVSFTFKISYEGKEILNVSIESLHELTVFQHDVYIEEEDHVDEIHHWTPESPKLYDLQAVLIKNNKIIDTIYTYFGMRKISVRGKKILLNNKPYYQRLILDQGYWKESGLTPRNEQALIDDIELTKKLGFNGARKHQKIEDSRYYYWADKIGLLVWGELPSAYHFNHLEMRRISSEMIKFIDRDYNHPSIITWVPLNESWGVRNIISNSQQQQFAKALYHLIKAYDPTRLISTNDGWEIIEASDIAGIHDYEISGKNFTEKTKDIQKLLKEDAQGRMLYSDGNEYKGEPILVTEFGGIALIKDTQNGNWGYHGSVSNSDEFIARFNSICKAIISHPDIEGFCYTQLTDVFQEVNGLLDMDRNPKISIEKIREIITSKRKTRYFDDI